MTREEFVKLVGGMMRGFQPKKDNPPAKKDAEKKPE
jgi:hypothetical protein